jgi:glycosyltransferase involved in cell wall biosynthesis
MPEIVVNGRFRKQTMTGIQRVAQAINERLQTPREVIEPSGSGHGVRGHLWEQLVLPARAKGRIIWGPCNVGPVMTAAQILTIHGAGVFDHPEWFSRSFATLNQTLWPVLARKARRIVTVSHFSQARLSEHLGIPKSRIDVIWNGVDETFAPASPAAVDRELQRLGLGGRPYFVTLSTIEPRKNLKLAFKAWSLARAALPRGSVLLVIGGRGASSVFAQGGAESGAEVDPSIVFTGYVEESVLPRLISGAIALIYPSLYEGFGLPVLEAMACGTPAITTRLTSLPEVGGEVAIYVDPHDPHDLAKQLSRLASSPELRADLAAQGVERAKLFTWEKAARQMDEVFRRYG